MSNYDVTIISQSMTQFCCQQKMERSSENPLTLYVKIFTSKVRRSFLTLAILTQALRKANDSFYHVSKIEISKGEKNDAQRGLYIPQLISLYLT